MSRGLQFAMRAMRVMIVCALAVCLTNALLNRSASSTPTPTQTVLTSTLTITNANNGQTFNNYRISTTGGDCVDINGASNLTFEHSNIGPCAGGGVYINGGTGNNIYDSYIHVGHTLTGCCDTRDGIFVNGSNYATIQGNVVAYSETNIRTFNANGTIIKGNFLLNLQGVFTARPADSNRELEQLSRLRTSSLAQVAQHWGQGFETDSSASF